MLFQVSCTVKAFRANKRQKFSFSYTHVNNIDLSTFVSDLEGTVYIGENERLANIWSWCLRPPPPSLNTSSITSGCRGPDSVCVCEKE